MTSQATPPCDTFASTQLPMLRLDHGLSSACQPTNVAPDDGTETVANANRLILALIADAANVAKVAHTESERIGSCS